MSGIKWGNMSMSRHSKSAFSDLVEEYYKVKNENRLLKLTYAKCRDCRHANEYVPSYAYPYILPKCELGVKEIDYDSNACEEFQMVGRNSR